MIELLKANFIRLWKGAAFRSSLVAMLFFASALMIVQATSLDYTVPLSRVIFLPMSMYGIVMAAFVSVFVGTDFSGGFVRNKILLATSRSCFVLSEIVSSCVACAFVYMFVTAFSAVVGLFFFENNVNGMMLVRLFFLGLSMSIATGCLFSVLALLCGNKSRAVILCMGLAFGMFFLCMHTNSILVQTEYKDGAINPHYVGGLQRTINGILHDVNPYGQAAQLSAWEVWHPARILLFNFVLIIGLSVFGCIVFRRKDID